MVIRSLFVILLMIGLMMPCAWAGVNDAPSPLSKVTIDAEDWVESDMYHIRYTFTNPTDEMIDEEISLTDITYDLCENKPLNKDITQCSETLSRLTIAPHSSYTTTVSLTPPVPTPFNDLLMLLFALLIDLIPNIHPILQKLNEYYYNLKYAYTLKTQHFLHSQTH